MFLVRSLLPVEVLLSSPLPAEGKLAFLGQNKVLRRSVPFAGHIIQQDRYIREIEAAETKAEEGYTQSVAQKPDLHRTTHGCTEVLLLFLLCFHCDIYKMTVHWRRPYKTAGMYSTIQKSRRLCSTSRFA